MDGSALQTNSSQSATATRTYDAFGNLVASTGTPVVGPFGFVGAEGYQEDGDSGLKLLGHRYYDPSTGRFLTRDAEKDGRNWYDYCDNNPLASFDPEGLQAKKTTPPQSVTVGNSGITISVKNTTNGNSAGVTVPWPKIKWPRRLGRLNPPRKKSTPTQPPPKGPPSGPPGPPPSGYVWAWVGNQWILIKYP